MIELGVGMDAVNIEAEQTTLGCFLLDGELLKETKLLSEHYFKEQHRTIFHAMKELERENIAVDVVTLTEKLNNQLDQVGGVTYITSLATGVPTTDNFQYYENIVLDLWKVRMTEVTLLKGVREMKMQRSAENLPNVISQLSRLEEVGFEDDFNLRQELLDLDEELDNMPDGLTGLDTGYPDLNKFTNGLQRKEVIVIAARPSMGKTAFALNLGGNVARKGNPVAIFSLEMPKKKLLTRMICAEGNIDATRIRNPKFFFSEKDYEKKAMAISSIDKMPLYIYDKPAVTVQEIRAKARKLRKKYPDDHILIIIDYLQLIQGSGKSYSRNEEIGEISRALKICATELDLTIVELAQLSRSVEARQDKRPMLSDIRDSGTVEQDADMIAFLYRDDYYDKETERKNITEVIIGKQRNGPTGTIELAFLKEYNKFVTLTSEPYGSQYVQEELPL